MEETGLPALLFLHFCSIVARSTMKNFDLKMHALKFNLQAWVLKLIPRYLNLLKRFNFERAAALYFMKFKSLTHAFHSLPNIATIFPFQIPHLRDWSYARWIWDFMCWKKKYWKIISASVLCGCTYCWLIWYKLLYNCVDKQLFKAALKWISLAI